jgi:hypothetical protein
MQWGGSAYDWIRLLRIPVGAIGVTGVALYYIRWLDAWSRQHAEEEFRLKRLDLDIDRASWMVEMMLEWQEEEGSAVPPELIDRLSRNLFVTGDHEGAVARHPAQDVWSAILQASSSVTVPLPGEAARLLMPGGSGGCRRAPRQRTQQVSRPARRTGRGGALVVYRLPTGFVISDDEPAAGKTGIAGCLWVFADPRAHTLTPAIRAPGGDRCRSASVTSSTV